MATILSWYWDVDVDIHVLLDRQIKNELEFEDLIRDITKFDFPKNIINQTLSNILDNVGRSYLGKASRRDFFDIILPKIQKLAKEKLNSLKNGVKLSNNAPQTIKLTRHDCLVVNCMLFLGIFYRYPPINNDFVKLYTNIFLTTNYIILESFLNYFDNIFKLEDRYEECLYLAKRLVGNPSWASSDVLKPIFGLDDNIESVSNQFMHAEVINSTNNILYNIFDRSYIDNQNMEVLCRPEIYACLCLVDGRLADNEVFVIKNVLYFASVKYEHGNVKFTGTYHEIEEDDKIITLPFYKNLPVDVLILSLNESIELGKSIFTKDLNMFYVCFCGELLIHTSNIGPRYTNPQLRFLQQWLAASKASCYLLYDVSNAEIRQIKGFTEILIDNNLNISMVYKFIMDILGKSNNTRNIDFFGEIIKKIKFR